MERLSGLDTGFLYAETETMHLAVGAILFFDRGSLSPLQSYDRILRLLSARIHLLPHFRKKVVDAPFGLVKPYWMDDLSFSLANHVRLCFENEVVNREAVIDFAAKVIAAPLNRSRPLWELSIIPSVGQNNFAIVAKIHHALTDGISGVEALASLFDLTDEFDVEAIPDSYLPSPNPDPTELLGDTLFGLVGNFVKTAAGGVSAARWISQMFASSADQRNSKLIKDLIVVAPRIGTTGSISPSRRLLVESIPLSLVKAVARNLSVKVNDVLVTLCHASLVGYLEEHFPGLPKDLVVLLPVSVRTDLPETASKNRLSALLVGLPTGYETFADLLMEIHKRIEEAKSIHSDLGPTVLYDIAEVIPPVFVSQIFKLVEKSKVFGAIPPPFNYVVSNVPGPNFDLYLAGSRLDEVVPIAPISDGSGLTFAFLSYREGLSLGVLLDPVLFPEGESLMKHFHAAVESIQSIGRKPKTTKQ